MILRAGPFASSGNSFLNEPIPDNPESPYPVNCAMDNTSSDWPWRLLRIDPLTGGNYEYDSAPSGAGDSYTTDFFNDGPLEGDGVAWWYQAVSEVTLSGTYAGTHTGLIQGQFIQFEIIDISGTLFFDNDSTSEGGSIGGDFSVTLPATVVPRFVRLLFTGEGESCFGSLTIDF